MKPELLNQLRAKLSPEDSELFDRLLAALAEAKDISGLDSEQQAELSLLIEKYGNQASGEQNHEGQIPGDRQHELWLPETAFGEYARQLLARHLNQKFSSEEDAFLFAFDNRFVPPELQDRKVAEDIFERYRDDIIEANQWREELVDTDSDPVMAVGLTWFMFIFQMAKRLRGES